MEEHRFKLQARSAEVDATLEPEHGWHDLQVRWLVTAESMGSESTVVGYSVFPPGAKHDLHRHPHAEEWEFVIRGTGIKRTDGVDIPIAPGDIVFSPRDSYHGVANTGSEVLETLWGYTGAGSLEQAGYELPSEDEDPDAPRGAWPVQDGAGK